MYVSKNLKSMACYLEKIFYQFFSAFLRFINNRGRKGVNNSNHFRLFQRLSWLRLGTRCSSYENIPGIDLLSGIHAQTLTYLREAVNHLFWLTSQHTRHNEKFIRELIVRSNHQFSNTILLIFFCEIEI